MRKKFLQFRSRWPSEKRFVGGDKDATELVHLGACEYDRDIGRFVSVDPVLDQAADRNEDNILRRPR